MMRLEVEATTPRVWCPEHGVHMAFVPWARMRSRFTRAFEDTATWLAVRTDRTTVTYLLRIAWRTVGRILERVSAEAEATRPPLKGLRRIGIDEVSYRKGHRYLTIVVDHDTGNLIWASPGRDAKTLRKFFRKLKKKGRESIELVKPMAGSTAYRRRATTAVAVWHPVQVGGVAFLRCCSCSARWGGDADSSAQGAARIQAPMAAWPAGSTTSVPRVGIW